MDTVRIAELLEPFLTTPTREANDQPRTANDALYQHISTYIDLLLRWNARINLTAIRDPEQIVIRHFGESLFAAQILFPCSFSVPPVLKDLDAPRVADLGSGAGFPGIPLKLWAPQISLTLIESNHKKCAFLREVARALTLTNINIQNARVETIPAQSFDLVTLRAVERFEKILPVAANLLAHAGALALLIGASQLAEARVTLPALSWFDPIPVPQSTSRVLLIARQQNRP
jgi:16S rRNA (guanine527-N7)-methyltransferase